MASEHVLAATNIIRNMASDCLNEFLGNGHTVFTPSHIDSLEESIFKVIKESLPSAQQVHRNFVREKIVAWMLSEFSTGIFGVGEITTKKEISEATIKKYQKAAKRRQSGK